MKNAVSTKTLVIAEKLSVAQDIVRALTPGAGRFEKMEDHFENDKYVVTSAVGHLVEIQAPEEFDVKRGKWSFAHLPVIPPHFELKPLDKTKTRLNAIVRMDDPRLTIVAQYATNLPGRWTNVPSHPAGIRSSDQSGVGAGCERRDFLMPVGSDPRGFMRLNVVYLP